MAGKFRRGKLLSQGIERRRRQLFAIVLTPALDDVQRLYGAIALMKCRHCRHIRERILFVAVVRHATQPGKQSRRFTRVQVPRL